MARQRKRTASDGATKEDYRAMGFSEQAAIELAARRIPAAVTANDVRAVHNNTQVHQTWSMQNHCAECEKLRTGADPYAPTNQSWLEHAQESE